MYLVHYFFVAALLAIEPGSTGKLVYLSLTYATFQKERQM